MKLCRPILCGIILCWCTIAEISADLPAARLVTAQRIWDRAPHNAFTDLVRFHDEWFCVFREGQSHVSPDGALRVIVSKDGKQWESAALISSDDSDLRDAKINVMPDGRLMLSGAEAMNAPKDYKHQSLVWFSEDGRHWSDAHEVADRDVWLWRTTWHKQRAYGFGYGCRSDNRSLRLYTSAAGWPFDQTLTGNAFDEGYPNETSLLFMEDDSCYCLLRRDGPSASAQLGLAAFPYTDWKWRDLGVKIGGPHMIRLPDGNVVAAVRLYDQAVRTALCWLDLDRATLTEFLTLPSGGDTSYAGLVWHDDLLWISYYSSHEGKTSIYLAKVAFSFD
jgi:hypothetical protein